jgi:putative ABC transport system substrate-binding protein
VAVIRDASLSVGVAQFAAIVSVAPSLGVELTPVNDSDPGELERAVADFARAPNGGLVLTGGPQIVLHRDLIAALAARHRLPAVYSRRVMVDSGGLASYGPDVLEHYRLIAGYVDRVLNGEKPADLPVQTPTKFEFVINLQTARTFGIEVPATLLAQADEVIE